MSSIFHFARIASKRQICLRRLVCARTFSSGDKLVNVTFNNSTEVSTVSLQRAPVNALGLELLQQLNDALDTLEKNGSAGMILTSAMPTTFSAGLDLIKIYDPKRDDFKLYWNTLQDTWLKLYGSSFPTVAAIHGHSPAGGCMLALGCEYRVMVGPKYTIGLNESKVGIVAPKWLRDAMISAIGPRQSELALTTGRLFKTDEALDIGLIDELATDKADAIKKAESFIERMARIPREARAITKKAVREANLGWLGRNREEDFNVFYGHLTLPHVQQGIKVYLDRLQSKKK